MRRLLEPPSRRPVPAADLVLTAAGVVLGLLTLALQRAADDATWREIDALAVVLVLLMTLPAATCRRAPVASAVDGAHGRAGRRRAGLPADVGMVLGAADRGGRRLPHRPPARDRARDVHARSETCWRRSPPRTRRASG